MDDLPEPLVSAEIDLRGMPRFMLDVDRLLASELVALGSPSECWAALMLWCRAWKQTPPASLPNDERVLKAFSGAGDEWPNVREIALRGFILCSDGRLYHRVLADEAIRAWGKRVNYQADQQRLKDWRARKRDEEANKIKGNGDETRFKTGFETPPETPLKPVEKTGRRQGEDRDTSTKNLPTEGMALAKTLTKKRASYVLGDAPAFDEFWRRYPRKIEGPVAAKKAWDRAITAGADPNAIITGVSKYPFDTRDGGRYLPQATTWLNQDRWTTQADTLPLPAPGPRRPTPTMGSPY